MAKDPSEHIKEFRAVLPRADEDFLGSIRDWKNIQLASDDEMIWLKGFTPEQAVSHEIRQMPGLLLYELREDLLFRKDALVPSRRMRTALLWTPIDKALKLTFPLSNNNFFGIDKKVEVKLKPAEEERPAAALLCTMEEIRDIIVTVPKFRLDRIDWIVIDRKALFLGAPLPALPGKSYWADNGHLLPAGIGFEFSNLNTVLQRKYNPDLEQWLLWAEDGHLLRLPKSSFRKLSVSSFRLTEKSQEWIS